MAHTVRMFIVDGRLAYIHHNGKDPSNDEPANHLLLRPGEKVRFFSRDANYSVDFGANSPFDSLDTQLSGNQGQATSWETILTPNTSGQLTFKYTAVVGGVSDDPDIIIDNTGARVFMRKRKKK